MMSKDKERACDQEAINEQLQAEVAEYKAMQRVRDVIWVAGYENRSFRPRRRI